ncbi:MAG: hypothetical protein K0R08_1344 [Solimicrobium sp.]|jgi:predicted Zn finger-like uncharacterized protein|nr:hypothetical protein [Solimicrobium sp.]
MLLATKCPHCSTTFKVANDQLKLQAGLVRCGICQQVFNGIDHLVEAVAGTNDELANNRETASNVEAAGEIEALPAIEQFSFLGQANDKKRAKRLFVVGTFVLLFLLIAQATYVFRNLIVATYAPAKSTLVALCSYLHCQIRLPAQLAALSYEGGELHTLPRENTYELSLLLQNHSGLTQAWPHIELGLQNAENQTVLKRVFTPADYVANPHDLTNGFPAHQEHAVRLYFELDQVKPSDYSMAIFYP